MHPLRHPRRIDRILLAFALALVALSTGCTGAAPYERGKLALPTMTTSDLAGPAEAHARAVQEGATGGDVAVGGWVRVQLSARQRLPRACTAILLASVGMLGVRGAAAQAPSESAPAAEPPPRAPVATADAAPAPPPPSVAPATPASGVVVHAASEIAGYADTDHVFILTPAIRARVESPTEGWSIGGSYLVDVVSAASVDIVSTASASVGEEVRQAGTVDVGYKPGTLGVAGTVAASVEPDYTSLNAGFVLSQDLLRKNLTLLGGYEHGHDIAGRSGTPFSIFAHVIDHDAFKLGVTGVVDPSTIVTGIAEVDVERGDTSKPYRYIPLFAPGTSVPLGASIDAVNATRLAERVLEQLPQSRDRLALTGRLAHRFQSATLRLDERVYRDSWSLTASSTDARFLVDATRHLEIGPHLRVHGQTPVSFWQRAYTMGPGFDFPALRTGDRGARPALERHVRRQRARGCLGPIHEPMRWAVRADLNGTYTWYLDNLYVTHRLSTVGGLSLEGTL